MKLDLPSNATVALMLLHLKSSSRNNNESDEESNELNHDCGYLNKRALSIYITIKR